MGGEGEGGAAYPAGTTSSPAHWPRRADGRAPLVSSNHHGGQTLPTLRRGEGRGARTPHTAQAAVNGRAGRRAAGRFATAPPPPPHRRPGPARPTVPTPPPSAAGTRPRISTHPPPAAARRWAGGYGRGGGVGGCLGTRPADSPRWGLAWFWRENAGKRRAASSAAPAAVRGSRNGFPLHPPPGSAASLPASPPQRAHGALAARRPPLRTSPLPPPPPRHGRGAFLPSGPAGLRWLLPFFSREGVSGSPLTPRGWWWGGGRGGLTGARSRVWRRARPVPWGYAGLIAA